MFNPGLLRGIDNLRLQNASDHILERARHWNTNTPPHVKPRELSKEFVDYVTNKPHPSTLSTDELVKRIAEGKKALEDHAFIPPGSLRPLATDPFSIPSVNVYQPNIGKYSFPDKLLLHTLQQGPVTMPPVMKGLYAGQRIQDFVAKRPLIFGAGVIGAGAVAGGVATHLHTQDALKRQQAMMNQQSMYPAQQSMGINPYLTNGY